MRTAIYSSFFILSLLLAACGKEASLQGEWELNPLNRAESAVILKIDGTNYTQEANGIPLDKGTLEHKGTDLTFNSDLNTAVRSVKLKIESLTEENLVVSNPATGETVTYKKRPSQRGKL